MSSHAVDAMRAGWLTLAFMMLLSRVVFQAAGARRMRAFLVGWQRGRTKRAWGAVSLAFAAYVAVAGTAAAGRLSTLDAALLVALVVVLVADGLVNVLPAGFGAFKSRLQDAWVRRHRGTGREGDAHLFGTVNALLALASGAAAAVVIAYRPIDPWLVAGAGGAAALLTAALIAASTRR